MGDYPMVSLVIANVRPFGFSRGLPVELVGSVAGKPCGSFAGCEHQDADLDAESVGERPEVLGSHGTSALALGVDGGPADLAAGSSVHVGVGEVEHPSQEVERPAGLVGGESLKRGCHVRVPSCSCRVSHAVILTNC